MKGYTAVSSPSVSFPSTFSPSIRVSGQISWDLALMMFWGTPSVLFSAESDFTQGPLGLCDWEPHGCGPGQSHRNPPSLLKEQIYQGGPTCVLWAWPASLGRQGYLWEHLHRGVFLRRGGYCWQNFPTSLDHCSKIWHRWGFFKKLNLKNCIRSHIPLLADYESCSFVNFFKKCCIRQGTEAAFLVWTLLSPVLFLPSAFQRLLVSFPEVCPAPHRGPYCSLCARRVLPPRKSAQCRIFL